MSDQDKKVADELFEERVPLTESLCSEHTFDGEL